jgi:hypothetical protein
LGNPLFLKGFFGRRNQFHDTDLSSKISFAFHALSIDEKRKNFKATLWNQQSHSTDQVLEQVWFTGVHSDVGGGYPENETGLSDIPLQWMIEKAQSCNLGFTDIPVKPDPMTAMHESYRGFYSLIPEYYRPIDQPDPDKGKTNEKPFPGVVKRYINNSNYRPVNLIDYFRRHPF